MSRGRPDSAQNTSKERPNPCNLVSASGIRAEGLSERAPNLSFLHRISSGLRSRAISNGEGRHSCTQELASMPLPSFR